MLSQQSCRRRKLFVDDKISCDATGFEDRRESTTGVCSAANEVDIFCIIQSVMRTELEHLIKGMSEIEDGTAVHIMR